MSQKSGVFTNPSGLEPFTIKMESVSPPPPSMSLPQYCQYATASEMSNGYQRSPDVSSSYMGGTGTSAREPKRPIDEDTKKNMRLMKNREAAKECRRKKKEYFCNLQYYVEMLENQNKCLQEELNAIKKMYNPK